MFEIVVESAGAKLWKSADERLLLGVPKPGGLKPGCLQFCTLSHPFALFCGSSALALICALLCVSASDRFSGRFSNLWFHFSFWN